jgi:hypothetical protein
MEESVVVVLNCIGFVLFAVSESLAFIDSPYNGLAHAVYKKWQELSLPK